MRSLFTLWYLGLGFHTQLVPSLMVFVLVKAGAPIALPLPPAFVGAIKWIGGILLLRSLFGLTLFARPRRRREYVWAAAFVLSLALAPLADPGERLGVVLIGPFFYERPMDWIFLLLPLPWLFSFRWRERLATPGLALAMGTALLSFGILFLNGEITLRAAEESVKIGGHVRFNFGTGPSEIVGSASGPAGLAWQAKDLCEIYAVLFVLALLNPLQMSIRRIGPRMVFSNLLAGLIPAALVAFFVLIVAALHTANYRASMANRYFEQAAGKLGNRTAGELGSMGTNAPLLPLSANGARTVIFEKNGSAAVALGDSLTGCSLDSLLSVPTFSSSALLLVNGADVYLRARADTLVAGTRLRLAALSPVDSSWMAELSRVAGKPVRIHPDRVVLGSGVTTDIGNPAAQPIGPEESAANQVPAVALVRALWWDGNSWGEVGVPLTTHAGLGEPLASLTSAGLSNPALAWIQISALWLIAVVLLGVAWWIGTMVFGMGRGITRAVGALTRGTAAIGRGELGYRIPIEGKDEIWSAAGAFNEMALGLERAREIERDKMRLEKELDIARQVQQNLFPKSLPTAAGWDFAALCRPAREVGGDYYDLFRIGEDDIAFALGDVSGKGLGPSLLMSNVQAMLRTGLRQTPTDVPRIAADLNEHLFSSSSAEMFVTVFIGVLDVRTGHLRYVNAGHNPPLVITDAGRQRASLETGGIIVGAVPGMRFDEGVIVLEAGDMVVVYSDGVTEAMNPSGEMFGDDRLNEEARKASTTGASEVLTGILGSVDRFVGEAEQADDISVIVIRRGP